MTEGPAPAGEAIAGERTMTDQEHETARRLRDLTEPIAAAVYFAPEAQAEYAALGLDFLEGYFCSRSACLGAAPGPVVAAVFAAFSPALVSTAGAADLLREHRGDGHVGAWIRHLDSAGVTALTEGYWGIPPRSYIATRGWSAEEVDAAYARLQARGLVADDTLTPAGRALRERIERDTDLAACEPVLRLGERADGLFALLEPWSAAIVEGGGYPVDPARLREALPR